MSSESNETEFECGEYESEIFDINEFTKPEPDEDVNLTFVNGAWYRGRVSRRLMEGEGTYFWNDGTVFAVRVRACVHARE